MCCCNGQPVKVKEDGSDLFSGAGVGEQASSSVLNILLFLDDRRREAMNDAIAIV